MMKRLTRFSVVAIGAIMAASLTHLPMAEAATWVKESGCTDAPGYVSYQRNRSSCLTARTQGADANLRETGDVYLDGFFIGTLQTNFTNTDGIYNRWSITINICVGANYFVTRNVIAPGGSVSTYNQTTGLMSHRGSACINN